MTILSTPNIDFWPRVSHQASSCPKFRFHVVLDKSAFVAGELLYGRLELVSLTNSSLQLGDIAIELAGFEELNDGCDALIESFLSSRILIQGENRPPSKAVRGWKSPDGFWQANKGRFTFPFAFKLPADAPCGFQFKSILAVKYKVTGLIGYKYHGKMDTVFQSTDAFVVESTSLQQDRVRVQAIGQPWLSRGSVRMDVLLRSPIVCCGQDLRLDIMVNNDTSKSVGFQKARLISKLQTLKVYTFRKLDLLSKLSTKPLERTDLKDYSPIHIINHDLIVEPGEKRMIVQTVKIPSQMLSVQKSILGEISCFALVSLGMGTFSKDLTVKVPFISCHPLSLMPLPEYNSLDLFYSATDGVQEPIEARSRSISPRTRPKSRHLSPPGRSLPWLDTDEMEGYLSDDTYESFYSVPGRALDIPTQRPDRMYPMSL